MILTLTLDKLVLRQTSISSNNKKFNFLHFCTNLEYYILNIFYGPQKANLSFLISDNLYMLAHVRFG